MLDQILIESGIIRMLSNDLIQCGFVELCIHMRTNVKILEIAKIDHVILPFYDGFLVRVRIGADMLAVGLLPDQIRIYADIFDNILFRLVLILLIEFIRLDQCFQICLVGIRILVDLGSLCNIAAARMLVKALDLAGIIQDDVAVIHHVRALARFSLAAARSRLNGVARRQTARAGRSRRRSPALCRR